MTDWHFFATRLKGDGTEVRLASELPLEGATPRRVLSGPSDLGSPTIPVEVARLKGLDGKPIFVPWSTAIYAEKDGQIRFGGIVTDMTLEDERVSLTVEGFTAYLHGMPYTDDRQWIQADPLDIARHIWSHVQGQGQGNLGVTLDNTKSPVRIGTEERDVEFDTSEGEHVEFTAGPYRLNWYSTHDLGQEFDNLAEETPFDYEEVHSWSGETIRHHIRLGYPTLGRRRHDLRFVVGENVAVVPTVELSGDDYASEVVFLGAGEGASMVRYTAYYGVPARLRRVAVVQDKSVTTLQRAMALANSELRIRSSGIEDVSQVVVRDHPNAPLHSWQMGDEILIQGSGTGWAGDLSLWVRVLEDTFDTTGSGTATLTVSRVERSAA